MTIKMCNCCLVTKEDYEFYTNKNGSLKSYCKKCLSEKAKRYYKKNSKIIKAQFKEYYKNNKERHQKTCAKYHKKNPHLQRYIQLKRYALEHGIDFNISLEDYKKLMSYLVCFATGESLSLKKHRNVFVSRFQMSEPYSLSNMEITNKETFHNKLNEHNENLREVL